MSIAFLFPGQGSQAVGMRQVLDTLVEGKSIEHKITFAEGLTTQQIVDKLRANPDLHGDIAEVPAEGTLLPDTYKFGKNDTRQDIIERMQTAQAKFLAKVWQERDEDIVVTTPQQALILASIVEKETGRADERPRIAKVFQNRLKKNMSSRVLSSPFTERLPHTAYISTADAVRVGGVICPILAFITSSLAGCTIEAGCWSASVLTLAPSTPLARSAQDPNLLRALSAAASLSAIVFWSAPAGNSYLT